jgi:hypothetical protein
VWCGWRTLICGKIRADYSMKARAGAMKTRD